jgi:FkbM family methyltransferase
MLANLTKAFRRPQVDAGLIFDLGLHLGMDAGFYLEKGFRVVGLEAVPEIAKAATDRLRAHVDAKRLVVENEALAHRAGETVSFFVVPGKDDWGSLTRAGAEKGLTRAVEIQVQTTTLSDLFDRHGTPYYVKCDIEGADLIFRDQLLADKRRPTFVSLENNAPSDLDVLEAGGYELVQIVNQAMNVHTLPPNPAREGIYVNARFDGHTSGLFGRELPQGGWITFQEARERLGLYRRLKAMDDNLAPGWIDLHVCRREALA